MALCLRISSLRSVAQLQIPRTLLSILNSLIPRSNVCSAIAKLRIVLSRYMPKKKEVHLKKLIKSTEEAAKKDPIEVRHS
jgi:hypothetical protein